MRWRAGRGADWLPCASRCGAASRALLLFLLGQGPLSTAQPGHALLCLIWWFSWLYLLTSDDVRMPGDGMPSSAGQRAWLEFFLSSSLIDFTGGIQASSECRLACLA